jgi:hypothetical protein
MQLNTLPVVNLLFINSVVPPSSQFDPTKNIKSWLVPNGK